MNDSPGVVNETPCLKAGKTNLTELIGVFER